MFAIGESKQQEVVPIPFIDYQIKPGVISHIITTRPVSSCLHLMQSYLHCMPVLTATFQDIPSLVALINSAYRGEGSKKGWTTEADLIKGELRTDEVALLELMKADDAVFLKYFNEQSEINGCVFIQKKSEGMYLGMLSVSPTRQAKGIGKKLMNEAQIHARQMGCDRIFMRVISLRHELIRWYEKQGYYKTYQTEPFPRDTRFGTPRQPLEFMIMEKMIP